MHPASAIKTPYDLLLAQQSKLYNDGLTRYRIEGTYLIHVGERNDDLVADGYATADEASVSALWNNAYSFLVTPFDNVAEFLGSFGFQNGGSISFVFSHPVLVERIQFGGRH